MMGGGPEETQPRTLYVGNLDPQTTEEFLLMLFSQIGVVAGCKIIHEPSGDPYAFVEFNDHRSAEQALQTLNGRKIYNMVFGLFILFFFVSKYILKISNFKFIRKLKLTGLFKDNKATKKIRQVSIITIYFI